ncbi:hypothetical protein [Saccharopolyspora sp. SCSIO 74807]
MTGAAALFGTEQAEQLLAARPLAGAFSAEIEGLLDWLRATRVR